MMRVLVVEDNPGDARLLEELLSEIPQGGFTVTRTATLADAVALASEHEVVLLDLSLPDANGVETVARMVAAARALPIVVLTGTDDDRTAIDAVAAGAQDYLRKSEITPALLGKCLRYAVERKKAEENAQKLFLLELERARSAEIVRRAQFVAEVTAAVSSSLDIDECLQRVAERLVPTLGERCAIDLVIAPERMRRIAIAPADATDLVGDSRAKLVTPLVSRDRVVGAITYAAARGFTSEDRVLADDIAERIALGIENARLFADAQRAIRGRDELLAIVSHDLRNPLGVVDLTIGMLETDPEALQSVLPRAKRAVDRMQRLIEDLLELARIDAGTLGVEPRPLDLSGLLEDAYEQHRMLAAEKGLKLVRDIAPRLATVNADRHRLSQVIANLLGNAIKFTPTGGTVQFAARPNDSSVVLEVGDTGPGIPREQLDHIFERFWQASARRKDGVGLGLAIVKGIVDAHGGRIDVESDVGRGTTFRITLPATTRQVASLQPPLATAS